MIHQQIGKTNRKHLGGGEINRKIVKRYGACFANEQMEGWLDFYEDNYKAVKADIQSETQTHPAQSSVWLLMFATHRVIKR